MKTRPLSLALLLVTMLYVVGCASPRAQWAVARSSLSTTENAIVAASQSGLIQDRDLVTLEPFAKSAQAALAEADKELTANNDQPTSRFRFYLNIAATTAAKLKGYQAVKK
jgi:hypothetical protein